MKQVALFIAISFAAGILFCNVYNSRVDSPNWGAHLPDSIITARDYYTVATPGNFYRIISPLNQVLVLLCIAVCWKSSKTVRIILFLALLLAVSGDVFTFSYFYPRNHIMFETPVSEIDNIKTAWQQWGFMNWFRSLLVAAELFLLFRALHLVYINKK